MSVFSGKSKIKFVRVFCGLQILHNIFGKSINFKQRRKKCNNAVMLLAVSGANRNLVQRFLKTVHNSGVELNFVNFCAILQQKITIGTCN